MKCKENIFLKSTFILIISGFFTKILGFVIRIIYSRIIGELGVALYSIATPTYSLLLTISSLAIPTAISKLIAENSSVHKRSLNILITSALIILSINFILILIMLVSSKFIACSLLNEPRSYPILIAMALTLPFVSISAVFKGYFYGKQNMIPHATSNIIEQIVRLVIIYIVLPKLMLKSTLIAVVGLVSLTIISEISSIIVFLFFLPKKIHLPKKDMKIDFKTTKSILDISLPTVSSRIIGNIGYFLEPIILTNLLKLSGYSSSYILSEYGIYNAYTLSLLTMPSFFVAAVAMSILPEVSKYYKQHNLLMVKRRIKQGIIFAAIIGLFFSSLIYFFRLPLLYILYHTTKGANYIKILAPIFVLFYLEGVLISSLQALNKAKISMNISLIGVVIKLLFLALLSIVHIGIYSLVISEIINIIFVVFMNYYYLKKTLNN